MAPPQVRSAAAKNGPSCQGPRFCGAAPHSAQPVPSIHARCRECWGGPSAMVAPASSSSAVILLQGPNVCSNHNALPASTATATTVGSAAAPSFGYLISTHAAANTTVGSTAASNLGTTSDTTGSTVASNCTAGPKPAACLQQRTSVSTLWWGWTLCPILRNWQTTQPATLLQVQRTWTSAG